MDMAQSPLKVKQWSSEDISIITRKLKHFQRINEQNSLTPSFRPLVTEVWELENGNNNIIQPTLPDADYMYGIALYIVEKDFCKKWKIILSKLVLGKDLNKFIDLNAVFQKKSEIQNFCQNQVLEKSSSFEKRAIKECYDLLRMISTEDAPQSRTKDQNQPNYHSSPSLRFHKRVHKLFSKT